MKTKLRLTKKRRETLNELIEGLNTPLSQWWDDGPQWDVETMRKKIIEFVESCLPRR